MCADGGNVELLEMKGGRQMEMSKQGVMGEQTDGWQCRCRQEKVIRVADRL